jgi:hypothetical protein
MTNLSYIKNFQDMIPWYAGPRWDEQQVIVPAAAYETTKVQQKMIIWSHLISLGDGPWLNFGGKTDIAAIVATKRTRNRRNKIC